MKKMSVRPSVRPSSLREISCGGASAAAASVGQRIITGFFEAAKIDRSSAAVAAAASAAAVECE